MAELCILLDTSTDLLVLGLFTRQGEIVASNVLSHANNLSKTLLPSLQVLVETQGCTPRDLCSIAVGIGPGSYTGTRVGVAVAKSLAFALQIPLQGFPSQLAFIPPSVKGEFSFLVPARSGNVFVLQGSLFDKKLRVHPHFFTTPEDLTSRIGDTICISNAPNDLPIPCLLSQLNLEALVSFLFANPSSDSEDLELLYLN